MPPSPLRKYKPKSRLRALDDEQRTSLREKALEIAERGLANRRGGPVDKGSPEAQQQAAAPMQGEKKIARDQAAKRSLTLHRNDTGNARQGGLFRTIQKDGGDDGRRVFVRRPAASRETGPTSGTYNQGSKPSGGAAKTGDLENLVKQRLAAQGSRPRAKRKLFSRSA